MTEIVYNEDGKRKVAIEREYGSEHIHELYIFCSWRKAKIVAMNSLSAPHSLEISAEKMDLITQEWLKYRAEEQKLCDTAYDLASKNHCRIEEVEPNKIWRLSSGAEAYTPRELLEAVEAWVEYFKDKPW
jgi:hypothetical protein